MVVELGEAFKKRVDGERGVGDLVSNYYEVVFWWLVEHRKRETGEFSK